MANLEKFNEQLEHEVLTLKKRYYTMMNGLISLVYLSGIMYSLYYVWNLIT